MTLSRKFMPFSGCLLNLLQLNINMHILHTLLGLLSTEGEFVKQSGTSLVGDHFSYSLNPNIWFRSDAVRRN